ncbi:hypothetical protein TMatcc_008655 [Talaromyces marneffei ATCC 18224]|uniref:Ankyrin repeat-containing protein, putative n=1 Tax=Talaromyces marneffei (strain ATCC 18224 / CBS 334.59 / QM 7333) TaxID=441960 RepID=B6QLE1_TALMQ|nr:ankyrin repeat-containing protein, putative [Talaromyces marneffei ATCC 18224]KAE8550611.1 hypothetical protein EYB25_006839 [Talaromyces marneffei]
MAQTLDLPTEILLLIGRCIETEKDINSVCQTSHRFHALFTPYLYKLNVRQGKSSALVWAAEHGRPATARLSLQAGARITASKDGMPLISWAARGGHLEVVKLLLDTGKVQIDFRGSPIYKTALGWAIKCGDEAIVKLLLDAKADVNKRSIDGATPLIAAAKAGHEGIVRLLIETGKVGYDMRDANSCTALFYAVSCGYEDIVERLLETGKVDVNIGDFHCRLPLSYAAEMGYEGIVRLLLETGKVKAYYGGTVVVGGTPLACAIKGGYVGIVKMLMDTGEPVMHIPDQNGQTALSLAEEGGNADILKLLRPEVDTRS